MTNLNSLRPEDRIVYIPTKGRPHLMEKIVPAWWGQGYEVRLVVERKDAEAYKEAVQKLKKQAMHQGVTTTRMIVLPASDQGIGYARNRIIRLAYGQGLETIIMADDDVKPRQYNGLFNTDDMALLQDAVLNAKYNDHTWTDRPILGCAPLYSFHNSSIALDGLPKRDQEEGRRRVFIAHTGLFQRCYALNVGLVMKLGNFDPGFAVDKEDNDLILNGINMGLPWTFHTGVWFNSIQGRYAPGGIRQLMDNENNKFDWAKACWLLLKQKWPLFVNDPATAKSPRVSWAKAWDAKFPGWKMYHAMKDGQALYEVK